MPNTREKLIELLKGSDEYCDETCCEKCPYDSVGDCGPLMRADHLIANGVTVQKEAKLYWKPVKPGVCNLTCSACDSHLGCREDINYCPECGAKFVYPKAVAPELSKGE